MGYMEKKSFDPRIGRNDLTAVEERRLTALSKTISTSIEYEADVTEQLHCRRSGVLKKRSYSPGFVGKQPDGLWSLPVSRLPEQIIHGHPQGHHLCRSRDHLEKRRAQAGLLRRTSVEPNRQHQEGSENRSQLYSHSLYRRGQAPMNENDPEAFFEGLL